MPNSGTITCPRCGASAAAGKRFCSKCGGPLTATAAAPATQPPARPAPAPAPAAAKPARGKGAALSIWWVVVPTAVFAFLSRQPIPIVIVVAIGAALWWAKSRPLPPAASPIPPKLQPYAPWAPALQLAVVFVALGGSPIAVALLGVAVFFAVRNRMRLIAALEPWWKVQTSIPSAIRKPLAFAVPFAFGYYFGINAGGREWTYTLISVSVGIVIAFLILFTPPDSVRRQRPT